MTSMRMMWSMLTSRFEQALGAELEHLTSFELAFFSEKCTSRSSARSAQNVRPVKCLFTPSRNMLGCMSPNRRQDIYQACSHRSQGALLSPCLLVCAFCLCDAYRLRDFPVTVSSLVTLRQSHWICVVHFDDVFSSK